MAAIEDNVRNIKMIARIYGLAPSDLLSFGMFDTDLDKLAFQIKSDSISDARIKTMIKNELYRRANKCKILPFINNKVHV